MDRESSVALSCGVGHRHGSGQALLWLWCRLIATAPIQPLTWELSYVVGVALKRQKKKKKREKEIDAAIRDLSEGYNITCGIDLKQK